MKYLDRDNFEKFISDMECYQRQLKGEKGIIKDLTNKDYLRKVMVASGDQFEIKGVGSVELKGEDRTVTITGVL
ncbi:hypothetical protein HDU81_010338 [Chytriomyces hyalinus]|nr:hypothetical protein HDU81_010338 [Chytriomyces hyalinus]